jgi:serine protease
VQRGRKRAGKKGRRKLDALQTRGTRLRGLVLASAPDGRGCGGPATVDVDRSLKPAARSLKGHGPLARVADPYGNVADFVANELVLATDSKPELDRALRRWRGRVTKKLDLGIPNTRPVYLIRISRRGKPAGLAADIGRLSRSRGTATRVSSEAGLGLLAAAADHAARDRPVGVNWVGTGADYLSRSTREAADGSAGFNMDGRGYTPNAYRWKHLASGSTQDIGVTSAWTLLAQAGRLRPASVRLAVLDRGFAPETNGADFGPDPIAISNVPFTDALGTSGSDDSPWHGTNVLNAAAAVPDNGSGAAGPAGPIARPVVVFTSYDYFTSIAALGEAYAHGARIVNMSYSARVPASLSWTVLPFDLYTRGFRDQGMLMFASAGNDEANVDAEDCFIVCWEEAWHTPCENNGVICVGGLGHNSISRADYGRKSGSNYGRENVDIWAPYTVLVGEDPGTGTRGAHSVNGTSFASPFAAGVTALGWAARPSASADELEQALRRTTRAATGPGRRYVDALAFVRDVLQRLVRISAPADGVSRPRGSPLTFEAFVYDDGLGAPTEVSWTLDGSTALGTGTSLVRSDLPYGNHEVTATARFPDGARAYDAIRINVTNNPPSVGIVAPTDGASFVQADTVTFRGASTDVNQPESGLMLRDDQVRWLLDGTQFATGHTATRNFSSVAPGAHTITFRGNDGFAQVDRSISVYVGANPPNLPPTVNITSPANNAVFSVEGLPDGTGKYYKDVSFHTTASDPEGGPLTRQWRDSINSGPQQILSTTAANPTIRLYYEGPACSNTRHDVQVRVTDNAVPPNTRSDTVRVFVGNIPC